MKLKIKVKDFNGKVTFLEKEMPAKDHLESQKRYKASIYKDKTKYTRKIKHRKRTDFPDA